MAYKVGIIAENNSKSINDISNYITGTKYENLDAVLSSSLMSNIEFDLFSKWQRELILKNCLKNILMTW